MMWEQVALGVVSLVAMGLGVQCWRLRNPWRRAGHELLESVRHERETFRNRARLLERQLDHVKLPLNTVWHHIRPETREEGAAVAALREVFTHLSIPGKPRLLDRDKAQAVLGALLQRAERSKRAADADGAEAVRAAWGMRYSTLREVMDALHLDPPEGTAPLKAEPVSLGELASIIRAGHEAFREGRLPEPPAHVLAALDALNAALKADPAAMQVLLGHRVPCNSALAQRSSVQVRSQPDGSGHTISAFGLLNGCLGVIPAGPCEGRGWLTLEEKSRDGEPLRCVLTTRTMCAWCRARSGAGTREHGGALLPICSECVLPASRGKSPLGAPPGWLTEGDGS